MPKERDSKKKSQSSTETQMPKIIEKKQKTFGNRKQQSKLMKMKVNLQDSIKLHEYQMQKSKSKSKLANFHGKIEKTKTKRSKSLSTKQRNN